jgi:hypothetical protein
MIRRVWTAAALAAVALGAAASVSAAGRAPAFTVTPLLRPDGSSENAISYGTNGLGALTSLSWQTFGTNTWLGQFGSTPSFVGQFDANLGPGIGGGGDADVDLGSTGTLHLTSLIFFFNPTSKIRQLGVSAVTCPNANVAGNFGACKSQVIDTTQADRQWITSRGSRVWIAYHDSGSSSTVHVQRSDDDGLTWRRVGDPIVGGGQTTGASTFNDENGPIVADPASNVLYDVYAYGTASVQKGTSADFNNVGVARSMDGGLTWTTTPVFNGPFGAVEDNVFPSLAVDPADGDVYATWSDQAHVYVAKSTDHGATFGAPTVVSAPPLGTVVFPWVAAQNGTVDVVYYGTTAVGNSNDETAATWIVYLSQSTNGGASFAQTQVSQHPNHVGPICTEGIACAPGTRNLLDLFEVAIDPQNGKAGILYTDDTLTTTGSGDPLPQAVLAQQR